jgi:hypothetical protein
MRKDESNLARRSDTRFYGVLFALAFGLNWIWENGQMFAYTTEAGDSWAKSLLFCTLASIVDAVVTVLIYVFLKFLIKPIGPKFYLSAAILGALCAVGFEWFAFSFGLWSYSKMMIVLPILGVGLSPLVQLLLLVPLAIWLTKKFCIRWRS